MPPPLACEAHLVLSWEPCCSLAITGVCDREALVWLSSPVLYSHSPSTLDESCRAPRPPTPTLPHGWGITRFTWSPRQDRPHVPGGKLGLRGRSGRLLRSLPPLLRSRGLLCRRRLESLLWLLFDSLLFLSRLLDSGDALSSPSAALLFFSFGLFEPLAGSTERSLVGSSSDLGLTRQVSPSEGRGVAFSNVAGAEVGAVLAVRLSSGSLVFLLLFWLGGLQSLPSNGPQPVARLPPLWSSLTQPL